MSERESLPQLAFEVTPYLGLSPVEASRRSNIDALYWAREARRGSRAERITSYRYEQIRIDKVIAPGYSDKDILELFKNDEIAPLIHSYIISHQTRNPFLLFWLSPPDKDMGLPEGRLYVSFGCKKKDGLNDVTTYGICLDDWLPQEYFALAETLSGEDFTSFNDIRRTLIPMELSYSQDPLKFVSQLMPCFDDCWEAIRHKVPEIRQRLELERIQREGIVSKQLFNPNVLDNPLLASARIQRGLERSFGIVLIDRNNTCGTLPTKMLGYSFLINQRGEIKGTKTVEGTYCRCCGECGGKIDKIITVGFRCPHCGGVYRGVC